MRKNSLIIWAAIAAIVSAGVFIAGEKTTFATSDRSSAQGDNYARDYVNRYGNSGGDVLGSAPGGAALGALLGGSAGGGRGAGTGAAIGGGVGALGGSVLRLLTIGLISTTGPMTGV